MLEPVEVAEETARVGDRVGGREADGARREHVLTRRHVREPERHRRAPAAERRSSRLAVLRRAQRSLCEHEAAFAHESRLEASAAQVHLENSRWILDEPGALHDETLTVQIPNIFLRTFHFIEKLLK